MTSPRYNWRASSTTCGTASRGAVAPVQSPQSYRMDSRLPTPHPHEYRLSGPTRKTTSPTAPAPTSRGVETSLNRLTAAIRFGRDAWDYKRKSGSIRWTTN